MSTEKCICAWDQRQFCGCFRAGVCDKPARCETCDDQGAVGNALNAEPCPDCTPAAWANNLQLLLCSQSPLEDQPNNPMLHNLPRNIAGSAVKTDYCNTPLYASPELAKWERTELERLRELTESQSEIIDKLVAKPKWDRAQDVEATSAMNTLLRMGYTYTGAGEWIMLAFDPGKPGSDMTATAVFIRDGETLTLASIEHSEPAKLCAASVGGLRCASLRAEASIFCIHHQSAKSRMFLTRTTSEELAFLMQRDGEQQ